MQTQTFKSLEDLSVHEQSFIDFITVIIVTMRKAIKHLMKPMHYYYPRFITTEQSIYQLLNQGLTEIPLTKGCVYYIRFYSEAGSIYLSNEVFTLKPELKYSYVFSEINIDNHSLVVRQNGEIMQIFHYPMDAVTW